MTGNGPGIRKRNRGQAVSAPRGRLRPINPWHDSPAAKQYRAESRVCAALRNHQRAQRQAYRAAFFGGVTIGMIRAADIIRRVGFSVYVSRLDCDNETP